MILLHQNWFLELAASGIEITNVQSWRQSWWVQRFFFFRNFHKNFNKTSIITVFENSGKRNSPLTRPLLNGLKCLTVAVLIVAAPPLHSQSLATWAILRVSSAAWPLPTLHPAARVSQAFAPLSKHAPFRYYSIRTNTERRKNRLKRRYSVV